MKKTETSNNKKGRARPTLNILIQLQELLDAKAQQEVAGKTHFENLQESITSLHKSLPAELRPQFTKLQKKDHLVVVRITEQSCSACAMNLPVGTVYNIRAADEVFLCPGCSRFLYYPDNAKISNSARPNRRYTRQAVGVSRFSAENLMLPNIKAQTKEEAIIQLCQQFEKTGFVKDSEVLIEEALRREAIANTAVPGGLAFPHIRSLEGGGLMMVVGTCKTGIRFDPNERALTRIIFLMAIPTAASAFYLKLLAGLTQSFREKTKRDKLLQAKTPATLWKALLTTTRTTIR